VRALVEELVECHVSLSTEPDDRRAAGASPSWAEDGSHFAEALQARRHDASAARIGVAHDRVARRGTYRVRAADLVLGDDGQILRE
jgi:hypothetical protein